MVVEAVAGPDSALLAEIEGLQLVARQIAQGALAGMHRSLRRGTSIEFSEHKLYSPGDDVRHIDWRAYAKTDRYHVKQFEDETNLRVEIILDHSGSMGFAGEGGRSKLTYARNLAGALGYISLRQGDSTGLFTFAADASNALPPRATSSHLVEFLLRLARLAPVGKTQVTHHLRHFAQGHSRRSVAIVLSDLFDPDPELVNSLLNLAARRHDVCVLHLLDRAEIEFNYETPAYFACMEDSRKVFIHPRALRSAFVSEMQKFLQDLSRRLSEAGIYYQQVITDASEAQALQKFLRSRQRGG